VSRPRPPRVPAATALVALVAFLPALSGAATPRQPAPAAGPVPVLSALETQVPLTDELHWEVRFTLSNPLPSGLYMDSVYVDTEDLDPGVTRTPRKGRLSMQRMVGIISDLSAGEGTYFQLESPSPFEHGWLDFHLVTTDAGKRRYPLHVRVEVTPGPTPARYPSRFLTVEGRKVEVVFVPSLRDSAAAAPGVLFVHDHGEDARKLLRTALALAHRGYAVMLVSMPGYGQSEGEPDYMGPATLGAAAAALDELARTPGVDAKRLAAWGHGRGANVAMALALRRPDLAAVVAESGTYDLWAAARGKDGAGVRRTIVAEAGRDSAAWRERSPAAQPAGPLQASVLLVHGEGDTGAPAAQARAFFAALQAAGKHVEASFLPGDAATLPRMQAMKAEQAFLARTLKP